MTLNLAGTDRRRRPRRDTVQCHPEVAGAVGCSQRLAIDFLAQTPGQASIHLPPLVALEFCTRSRVGFQSTAVPFRSSVSASGDEAIMSQTLRWRSDQRGRSRTWQSALHFEQISGRVRRSRLPAAQLVVRITIRSRLPATLRASCRRRSESASHWRFRCVRSIEFGLVNGQANSGRDIVECRSLMRRFPGSLIRPIIRPRWLVRMRACAFLAGLQRNPHPWTTYWPSAGKGSRTEFRTPDARPNRQPNPIRALGSPSEGYLPPATRPRLCGL